MQWLAPTVRDEMVVLNVLALNLAYHRTLATYHNGCTPVVFVFGGIEIIHCEEEPPEEKLVHSGT